MKEWRDYISEDNACWTILADKDKADKDSDKKSRTGQDAVISMCRKPGNYISISIISASREFDTVTGRLGFEKDFYIRLDSLSDGWSSISTKSYKSDEALQIAKVFLGLTTETAQKIWKAKKLGEADGCRINQP